MFSGGGVFPFNFVLGTTYYVMNIALDIGVWNIRAQYAYNCGNTTTTQALCSITTDFNNIDYGNMVSDWRSLTAGQYVTMQVNRTVTVTTSSQTFWCTVLFFYSGASPRIQITATTNSISNISAVKIA
jgi:hypothetical protein